MTDEEKGRQDAENDLKIGWLTPEQFAMKKDCSNCNRDCKYKGLTIPPMYKHCWIKIRVRHTNDLVAGGV